MTTLKAIKSQKGISRAKARMIAHLMADGSVCRSGKNKTNYWVRYEVNNKKQLQGFASDLRKVYGLEPKRDYNPSGFTGKLIPVVFIRSKMAYEDLSQYGSFRSENWNVPQQILDSSVQIKKEFLRAFFDDEGTVTSGEIRLYSINESGLKQIKGLLEEFGVYSRIKGGFGKKRNVYGLVIHDKGSVLNFRKGIGFKIGKKMRKLDVMVKRMARSTYRGF